MEKIMKTCLDRGLLLIECGEDRNIVRLIPPLSIKKEEMDKGLDILEEAIAEL